MSKNIVLLGASNSLVMKGLQKGLRESIEKFNLALEEQNQTPKEQNQADCNQNSAGGGYSFYNLALSACDTTQKIYALKKQENQEILQGASLIIIEANTNDHYTFGVLQHSYKTMSRNFAFLCKELSNLHKRVLFLILPFHTSEQQRDYLNTINNFYRIKIKEHGFNFIDMQRYYEDRNLNEFYATTDPVHQLGKIMCLLSENIIKYLESYKESPIKEPFKTPEILVTTPPQMFDCELECQESKSFKFLWEYL